MPDAIEGADREGAELSPAAAELVTVARTALGFMSDAQRAEGLVALRDAIGKRARRRAAWRVQALAATGVAAVACAAFMAWFVALRVRTTPPDLSFRVDGAALDPSGAVRAGALEHPVVRFSDGSEVVLDPDARVHVHVLGEHGARVTLDEGHAHVDVVHTPETRWVFGAGPFVVAVTGTAFGIGWAENERRLDVRLENGSVSVSGPVSDAPLALRAGQWLTVHGSEVLIRGFSSPSAPATNREEEAAGGDGRGSASAPNAAPEPSDPEAPTPPPIDRPVHDAHDARPPRWTADLAAGKFDAIVADATKRGLPEAYATSRAADLAALADAARYTHHDDVAESALAAERRRFPGTDYAHVAAFSLGRLSETEGDLRTALSWYETYLKEAPAGTFASEALGRKMVTVEKLDGRDAAVPLAQAYLARFPNGTYAKPAKALASTQPR